MKTIHFLKRREVDEQKWNQLISQSIHSLPYALSWYLDIVAENWDALILNDYEAAMPLVWLRKLGVKCLYQPYYCQQLGVFSKENLPAPVLQQFLDLAAGQFPYLQINLNPGAKTISDKFNLEKKKNLLLLLNRDYMRLQKNYSENHRRNISKAKKAGLKISEEIELRPFQKFYLENIYRTAVKIDPSTPTQGTNKVKFEEKHEKIFKKLSQAIIARGKGKIIASVDEGGQLCAAMMVLFHENRIINIINNTSAEGKKNGSSHFLLDQLIRQFANQEAVLDFEGSSIPSIARFYEGFGAEQEVFYCFKSGLLKNFGRRFL